jgi:hypothetical protein
VVAYACGFQPHCFGCANATELLEEIVDDGCTVAVNAGSLGVCFMTQVNKRSLTVPLILGILDAPRVEAFQTQSHVIVAYQVVEA